MNHHKTLFKSACAGCQVSHSAHTSHCEAWQGWASTAVTTDMTVIMGHVQHSSHLAEFQVIALAVSESSVQGPGPVALSRCLSLNELNSII